MTKKANGVYYTPQPVVDYIVKNTLGPLLVGKSPMALAGCTATWQRDSGKYPLTILDPACGSGHLLLGAYRFLLEWFLKWYIEDDADYWLRSSHPRLQRIHGSLQLCVCERQRILSEHIYGVDTDEQAIDIANHELLEEMTDEACDEAPAFGNIRCGNSLIDSDFQSRANTTCPNIIRVFDWKREFPAIIARGGFDAVIANPPYVNARLIKQTQGEVVKEYYREKYRGARRAFDLYTLFVERSHQLLRCGGRAGMIVPNKIATLDYARTCRKLLLAETTLEEIADVSNLQLFPEARVYPYILTWTKVVPDSEHHIRIVMADDMEQLATKDKSHYIRQASWTAESGFAIHSTLDVESRVRTQPLVQRGSIHSGTTGFSAGKLANELQAWDVAGQEEAFEFIVSGNIDRYSITLGNVRFMKRRFARPVLPKRSSVLSKHKRRLFSHPKIVIAGMSRRLEAAFDERGLALGVQVYAIADLRDDPRFILGLLNSKLMSYLLRTRFHAKQLAGGYLAVNKGQLAQLPIRSIDDHDRQSNRLREDIIKQVERRENGTTAADDCIDQLVFELYALTNDEISTIQRDLSTRDT